MWLINRAVALQVGLQEVIDPLLYRDSTFIHSIIGIHYQEYRGVVTSVVVIKLTYCKVICEPTIFHMLIDISQWRGALLFVKELLRALKDSTVLYCMVCSSIT